MFKGCQGSNSNYQSTHFSFDFLLKSQVLRGHIFLITGVTTQLMWTMNMHAHYRQAALGFVLSQLSYL